MRKTSLGYIALAILGILIGLLINQKGVRDYQAALVSYKKISAAEAQGMALRTNDQLKQIYQNIRTISLLPNIKNLDRHATNLEANTRSAINEIYHNLVSNVSVSEIYIVPADLNPDAIDPVTKSAQIPNIMFDGSIAGAAESDEGSGPKLEEVETFEYHQLPEHMAWFKNLYPTNTGLTPEHIPMISGNSIITCDNSQYKQTLKDPDRTGIIFSVPIYDLDGKFKGTVSAIILNNILADLISKDVPKNETYGLINTGYKFAVSNYKGSEKNPYQDWLSEGKPDPELYYSSVIPLSVNDPQSSWALWVGFDNELFLASDSVKAISSFYLISYSFDVLFILVLMIMLKVISRNNNLIKKNNAELRSELEDRMREVEQLAIEKSTQQEEIEAEKNLAVQNVAEQFERAMFEIIQQVEQTSGIVEKAIRSVLQLAKTTKIKTQNVSIASNNASDKAVLVKENIFSLARKASEISDVIQVITSIASEINLLAINANIEAFRAQEAGKSFAVVAGEVKNLADQVSRQTDEIKRQIKGIQLSTSESVDSVMNILSIIDPMYAQDKKHESIAENISHVQESVNQTEETADQLIISVQCIVELPALLRQCMDSLLITIRNE